MKRPSSLPSFPPEVPSYRPYRAAAVYFANSVRNRTFRFEDLLRLCITARKVKRTIPSHYALSLLTTAVGAFSFVPPSFAALHSAYWRAHLRHGPLLDVTRQYRSCAWPTAAPPMRGPHPQCRADTALHCAYHSTELACGALERPTSARCGSVRVIGSNIVHFAS